MGRTKEEIEQCLETGLKLCNTCGYVKPLEDFSKDKTSSDGYNYMCKKCRSKSRSATERLTRSEDQIAFDIEHKSKVCRVCKKRKPFDMYYKMSRSPDKKNGICKECRKPYMRKKLLKGYGLSTKEYKELEEEQGGKCAICGATARLCVDHNHETGEVRGLLCTACNLAIGNLQDSPVIAAKALEYLTERGCYGEK